MSILETVEQKVRQGLGEHLVDAMPLPTFIPEGSNLSNNNLMIRVKADGWLKAGELLCHDLNCTWFDFLSAVDWMDSPYGRQLDTEQDEAGSPIVPSIDWGLLGGDTRLQVLARVRSIEEHFGVILKADLPDEGPAIDSWTSVYPGANWNERETWEMFGIRFDGHPRLVHIYLPTEFEGYPLRKDFPLLARKVKPWPGVVDVELMPDLNDEEEEIDS